MTAPVSPPSAAQVPSADALMTVSGLTKHFPVTRGIILRHRVGLVRSVDDVSFEVTRGDNKIKYTGSVSGNTMKLSFDAGRGPRDVTLTKQ